ncbi:MAG: ABC transporter permease [Deltaproteobacteria bacterium]|nr:ABC transporter permease [Deltaproteobacteria bacterium]
MPLPFEATVALRYIRSKRRGPVSLITMITIGGVAAGVAALTVVTSVWNGFEAEFLDKLLGINAHAVVLRRHDVFRNHREVEAQLRQAPGITNVQPFVYSEVIAQSSKGVSGVAIKGIDPALAAGTALAKYLPPGAFAGLTASSTGSTAGIFIGRELAESLHAASGDTITIISPYGGGTGQPRTAPFRVSAVFHSGMYEFDARMVFIEIGEAQRFFRLYQTVTGLEVWSADPLRSAKVITAAAEQLDPEDPAGYEVRDWSRTNRGLFGAVKSQKGLITLVLGFIVLVAAFNIVATLILLILEKSREIAVLKSIGASNRSILMIFVIDGQIVGIVGCLLGVLLGLAICVVLEAYGLKLDPRVYYLENLPIVVRPIEVFVVAAGAMLASTLATLFPAYKAARLPPVDGLRLGGGFKAKAEPAAPRG